MSITLLTLATLANCWKAQSTCDEPFSFLAESGTCVHYGDEPMIHDQALAYCQEMDARLVGISVPNR